MKQQQHDPSIPDVLLDVEYLSPARVAKMFHISRQTLYGWMQREEHPFPEPKHFGPRVSRFLSKDIIEWLHRAPIGPRQ